MWRGIAMSPRQHDRQTVDCKAITPGMRAAAQRISGCELCIGCDGLSTSSVRSPAVPVLFTLDFAALAG